MTMSQKHLSALEKETLIVTLKTRFNAHKERHPSLTWNEVETVLNTHETVLYTLSQMELTQGEPDVVQCDESQDIVFMDCSEESPKGRRNVCYDELARLTRKKFPPETDALTIAKAMGAKLLDEKDYRKLQEVGQFDKKTSSWILTPLPIRDLGGALFCDFRYNTVFVYHNGADSYYSSRGFRVKIVIKRS
ncbi:hypothetical protein AOC36_05705 [Erysipelothrix larvae]|uniref:DUF4256 domain-containing protein n=2 Tax=Erysipelothrix larvae TaxID=1514105 RepID=A0A0X8GZW7_9FIRM|nr:hypothetical protein AOC36_05705 [Erysipelothrix larvae]